MYRRPGKSTRRLTPSLLLALKLTQPFAALGEDRRLGVRLNRAKLGDTWREYGVCDGWSTEGSRTDTEFKENVWTYGTPTKRRASRAEPTNFMCISPSKLSQQGFANHAVLKKSCRFLPLWQRRRKELYQMGGCALREFSATKT
eukprot:1524825-Rhodomonas_salina.1